MRYERMKGTNNERTRWKSKQGYDMNQPDPGFELLTVHRVDKFSPASVI
jgi:hypothetical protein